MITPEEITELKQRVTKLERMMQVKKRPKTDRSKKNADELSKYIRRKCKLIKVK